MNKKAKDILLELERRLLTKWFNAFSKRVISKCSKGIQLEALGAEETEEGIKTALQDVTLRPFALYEGQYRENNITLETKEGQYVHMPSSVFTTYYLKGSIKEKVS